VPVKRLTILFICLILTASLASNPSVAGPNPGISLPDDKTGHQIQIVYVETDSAKGSNYHTNGQITEWVNELQTWLQKQIGKELIFDTHKGNLDISYLRYDKNVLYKGNHDKTLIKNYRDLNPKTYFGKTIAFIIDQTIHPSENEGPCGWAANFSDYALIFPNLIFSDGASCDYEDFTKVNSGFSRPAKTLLHELIHAYGADHVCPNYTDLMLGSPQCDAVNYDSFESEPLTFDITRQYYFGGDKSGVDLEKLKIWSDGTGIKNPRLDQGICWVGEICSVSDWNFTTQGTVQLQLKSGAKWVVVNSVQGQASNRKDKYKFRFNNTFKFTKSGNFQYRIVKLASKNFSQYVGPTKSIKVIK
jgi:hypothetical protein